MMYDGRRYAINHHLGWRQAHDGGHEDVYAEGGFTTDVGQRMPSWHVNIFRIKDAEIVEMEGRRCYDQASVPSEKCVPICAHSATNVALGVPKLRKAGRAGVRLNIGRHNGDVIIGEQQYVEQAHYLVKDGRVYQWTSRRLAKPEDKPA